MDRVVIFGIKAKHQPKMCDEFRLSLNLNDRASETSLTLPGDLGSCVFVWVDENVGSKGREFVTLQ